MRSCTTTYVSTFESTTELLLEADGKLKVYSLRQTRAKRDEPFLSVTRQFLVMLGVVDGGVRLLGTVADVYEAANMGDGHVDRVVAVDLDTRVRCGSNSVV